MGDDENDENGQEGEDGGKHQIVATSPNMSKRRLPGAPLLSYMMRSGVRSPHLSLLTNGVRGGKGYTLALTQPST